MEWLKRRQTFFQRKTGEPRRVQFSWDRPFRLIPVERDCIDFIVLFAMGIVGGFYPFVKTFLRKLIKFSR
jgi:hypothetical protein